MIYVLGFKNSHIYDETTSYRIALHANFEFRNSLSRLENYSKEEDVLIRYGNHSYASYDKYFSEVINKAVSIRNNCNKLETHLKLLKAGLRVPKVFTSKEEIESSNLPVFRRSIYHSRGTDIRIINSLDSELQGSYFSEFIPSNEEYRFHIMFGECVRISKKIPKKKIEQYSSNIRSSRTGWTLTDRFEHNFKVENEGIELCIKALKILDLDFGACDVVIHNETQEPYLLEVNTAPRLGYYGREVYVKEFLEHLNLPTEGIKLGKVKDYEHYDILKMKYRKAISRNRNREDEEEEY